MDIFGHQLSLSALAFTAIAVYIAYLAVNYHDRGAGTRARPDLPGPPGLPLIGNLLLMIKNESRQNEHRIQLGFKYAKQEGPERGIFTLTAPFLRVIVVSKPGHVEHIQKTNFENYVKGTLFLDNMSDVLGRGIFVVDGHEWIIQRKTTSHIFTIQTFKGPISSAIREHLATLRQLLQHHAKSNEQVDLTNIFFRFTLDSFVKMGFGQNLHSLVSGPPQPDVPFARAFDFAQRRMSIRFSNPFAYLSEGVTIPFLGWNIQTKAGKDMAEAKKIIFEFCENVIREKEKELELSADKMPLADKDDDQRIGKRDLLSLYMDLKDENGQRLPRAQLREIILNLFIAGRDTTAQTLSWCFFHFCKNPKLLEPLRREIDEQLGAEGEVTYDNYKTLKQAMAAFNETLRLHPSVPSNVKMAQGPDQIVDGPRVDKGDFVVWSDWGMGRDPRIWGRDCLEFKPSRWIDEKGELKRESQWKLHAFNGGPRVCLGQTLATFEAVSVMVELVRSFDFEFALGWYESVPKMGDIAPGLVEHDVPLYESSLTLPMKHPLLVSVKSRE